MEHQPSLSNACRCARCRVRRAVEYRASIAGEAEADRVLAEPGVDRQPFARTYDCEAVDMDADYVVFALVVSARDAANLLALSDGAAIVTGEVTVEATATGFIAQLDNYTVFS